MTTRLPGEMKCRVCGWWPPLVRVDRHERTHRASEGWRWGQLRHHVIEVAVCEMEDGNPHGAHVKLHDELDAKQEAEDGLRPTV